MNARPRNRPDHIDIEGLEVRTIIGIFAWERKRRQRVVLDLRMETDARRAARRDDVADALDYKTVCKGVQAFVAQSKFRLVESLAEAVAALLQDEFGVRRVRVRVSKPRALRGADNVSVTIEREVRRTAASLRAGSRKTT